MKFFFFLKNWLWKQYILLLKKSNKKETKGDANGLMIFLKRFGVVFLYILEKIL